MNDLLDRALSLVLPVMVGLIGAGAAWLAADNLARWIAFIVTGEFPR